MAYAMTKQGSLDNCVTYEFICDTIADMNAIENKYRTIGSVAVVLTGEGGGMEAYITGSNKQWNNLGSLGASNSGSSSSTSGLSIYICAQNEVSNGKPNIASPDETTIYLVSSGNESGNLYEEYVYVNNAWEKFGSGNIDLSGYATKANPIFTGSISLNRKSDTTAGDDSIAVGYHTASNGDYSVAFGRDTEANGTASFAGGEGTIAAGGEEFAIGCNNALPAVEWQANTAYAQNDYVVHDNKLYYCATPHTSAATFEQDSGWYHAKKNLFTIGNGNNTSSRANAYVVDLWGNGRYKGDVYVGCNSDSTGGNKVATETYVTNTINNISYEEITKISIPNYYFINDYLDNKCNTFNMKARDNTELCDTFAFITDLHWHLNQAHSPAILRYIKENTRIDKLFCGGDICDFITGEAQPFDAFTNLYKAWQGPIYTTMGNHDYMASYGKDGRLYYSFNSVGRDRIGNMKRNYFYIDNPQAQIRYIFLNGFKPGNNTWDWGYEQEQLDWLENTALNLEAGYGAIIITHMIYAVDTDNGTISIPNTSQSVLDILDDYSGNGEIIAVICGHTHCDYIDTTTGGIPIIVTTCDKNIGWIDNNMDKEPWLNDRVTGTIKEQAIDLFTINRAMKQIIRVRIGCPIRLGIDPTAWTELEYQTIDYDHGPETLSFVYSLGRYNHKADSASEDYVYNEVGTAPYCSVQSDVVTPKYIRGGTTTNYPIKFKSGASTITVTVPNDIRVTAWFVNSTVACNASQSNSNLETFAKLISGDASAYDPSVPTGTRILTIPSGADSVVISLQQPGGSITDEIMANVTIVAS